MPIEIKPLFRPDALRPKLKAFHIPAETLEHQTMVQKWANLLASEQGTVLREQELLREFIGAVFGKLLGYETPAENAQRYTLAPEKHIQANGKFADAVLGEFKPGVADKPIIALEGKGPKDPLDRPYAGRKKSAVDQGYGYAINLPCDWIIVTSMVETRLYHKGSDQQTCELFNIHDLAESEAAFRKFVFLLGAQRVAPVFGRCHLYDLKEASEKIGQTLTKKFYVEYANIRQEVFESLCKENETESPHELLSATQKLLDRVLFTAFCEDRGLLPDDTLKGAFEHSDPYNPRPIWSNFRGLFHAIDAGNADLNIPPYNGGLFADDPFLEKLNVPDAVCANFRDLGDYEYRPTYLAADEPEEETSAGLIDVEILGHIFEQSITDLEQLRNELDGRVEPVGKEKHKTRRKKEGAFYTPAFITRYIIEQSLGPVLADRFETLRQSHAQAAKATAAKSLAEPEVYELEKLNKPQKDALIAFWEAWQEELITIRILDPACGSGAFLIEAFDQLHQVYRNSNEQLTELRGHRSLFDLDKRILENNLYGVDLNEEAIEICRLSLWIKTAEAGKQLTSLDHSIRVGNSVVNDSAVHPKAFNWQDTFPEVFKQGGFDVVVGNPPYVRQEWLTEFKPHLQSAYESYHGMADLYVYFYELGMKVLKPAGLLSFIVTNKWMKAGYGEPLRRYFAENAWVESVVDFGHAKQIFPDADVFPSIIVARKPTQMPKPTTAKLCAIPREQLRVDDLSRQIETEGMELPLEQLTADSWQLEPREVSNLLAKIRAAASPLSEFTGNPPLRGILTGLNKAFLIDDSTKDALVTSDPSCSKLIRRNYRGQDFERWNADWGGYWMICIPSSENVDWPWSNLGEDAEKCFDRTFPSIAAHFAEFRAGLQKRQDKGRFWWELRSCAYWSDFDRTKIMYPEITWRAQWCLDTQKTVCNNTAYFISTDDLWILAVANSPIQWWYSWRNAVHGKDEALRFIKDYVHQMPIPEPTANQRIAAEPLVSKLIETTAAIQTTSKTITDWLRVEYELEKPGRKLGSPTDLTSDEFVAEVKKRRGKKNPLTAAGLKNLRNEHAGSIEPARRQVAQSLLWERELSDLVNEAYGLTPDEIALMWKTAPPRMPIASH